MESQVGIYHLVNGPQYSIRRAVNILQAGTGKALKIMDTQDWLSLCERLLPTSTSSLSEPAVAPEFLAWASAFVPRGRLERERVMAMTGMDVSCIQFQDRLRRLIVGSGLPRSYHSLLDEVRSPDLDTIDKALADNFTNAGTRKTRHIASRSGRNQAVVKRNAGALEAGVQNWILNTPSLAFLSVFLYAILGTS